MLDSASADRPSSPMDGGRVSESDSMTVDAGSDHAEVDAGPADSCPNPRSCEDVGAECGPIEDGCGGFIHCGDCVAPETCGGGGMLNQCGSGGTGCVPTSCETLGAQCGDIGDGCGGMLACGGCPDDQNCNSNRCVCRPKTCGELNAECGDPDDGCGAPLDCGPCAAPETCGGGGTPYQCGCTTQAPTAWVEFRRARNVGGTSGTTDWEQMDAAERIDGDGARFRVIGTCVKSSGLNGSGCNCCTRVETRTRVSEYLKLDRAGLQVPSNAVIRGIEVKVPIRMRGGVGPGILRKINLVGAEPSANLAGTGSLGLADPYRTFTFGGPTEMWGRAWTPADVNDPDFALRIQMMLSSGCVHGARSCDYTRIYVDGARVRVHYDTCE